MAGVTRKDELDLEKTIRLLSTEIQKGIEEQAVPSISIALVKESEIVWSEAFGYSNVRTKTPATLETYYNTLSTFKSVTATAVMQLVEQGRVNLDDPVNKHLGDSQIRDELQSERPVTFRHILSHWSGLIPDVIGKNHVPIWGRGLKRLKTLKEITSGLCSIRAPEEMWEYNNLAYALAGLLIEKISGTEYEEYIVNNVLRPLGINTLGPVFPTPEMVELMAIPYTSGEEGKLKAAEQIQYSIYPAGDVFLTAEDMARFLGAHLNEGAFNGNRILSAESVKEMQTPQFTGDYGLGFHINKDDRGHTIITHTGGAEAGYSAIMIGDVTSRVGVYCMSNCNKPIPFDASIAIKLLRGDYVPPEKRKVISLETEKLNKYVGEYRFGGTALDITREGNRLFIKTPLGPKTELFAESDTKFFAKTSDVSTANITFSMDARGVVQLIVDWQGQRVLFQQIK